MKKLLVTGGALFCILPAMATDLSLSDWHLIDSNTENPTCSGPEGYTGFVNGDVTMAPLYIQQCDPGYYLNATSETQIQEHQDSNEDLDYYYIQACTQCPVGHSCAGVSNPTVVNDSLGVMGLGAECSAGTYAAAGQGSCTACAPGTYTAQTGQSSCTNAQAGYYTPNTTSEELCPVGYQDGAAGSGTTIDACSKTVDSTYCNNLNLCSNFNNIVTTGNNACSASVNTNNSSIVTDTNNNNIKKVLFGNRGTEPLCVVNKTCLPGYTTTNMYAWLAAHPESVSGTFSYCPHASSVIGSGQDSTYNCTDNEAGTFALTLTGGGRPLDKLHFITKCSSTPFDFENPASLISTSISDTGGGYCWFKNIDFPNQPWIGSKIHQQSNGDEFVLSEEACSHRCGHNAFVPVSQDYMFGSMQNGNFVLNENYQGTMLMVSAIASMTDGQGGRPSADVCVASTVNINWAGVAEPGAAATCTYGEGLTVPTPDTNPEGYNFVGWTVGEVTNNNNNNQNNNEPSNEEPE